MAGYRAAMERNGLEYDPNLVVDQQYHMKNPGREMLQELLMLNDGVTAILLLNNNLCEDVLLGLREMNKKIPDDLSLLTWDDTPMNDLLQITTIAQFPELIGKAAANQAIKRIQETSAGQPEDLFIKTFDTELRVRSSCRKI